MKPHSESVRKGAPLDFPQLPTTDFARLTKDQLVARLKHAEWMMIHMANDYRESAAQPEPFPFAHAHDRGYARAMESALNYITQPPDWLDEKSREEVA